MRGGERQMWWWGNDAKKYRVLHSKEKQHKESGQAILGGGGSPEPCR